MFGESAIRDCLQLFVKASNADSFGKNSGSLYIFDRQNINEFFLLRQRLDGEDENIYFGTKFFIRQTV